MSLKTLLKRFRRSQPFNRITTSTLQTLFAATNWHPEFVVKHLPRVGVTRISLPEGKTILLDSTGEDWIPNQVFWRGWQGYEPEVTAAFYQLATKSKVIIDVGAHVGFFSVLAGVVNPSTEVYAFEPLQRVYERLDRNVSLNKLNNVKCFLSALGSEEGEQEFYFPDEHAPVSSSLRSDVLLESLGERVKHVTVPVMTLDGVVDRFDIPKVDLIKLDTERTEHEVLAGSRETLRRDKPDIICEIWPDANNAAEFESLLKPLGYRYYHLTGTGLQLDTRITPSMEDLNYLFTVSDLF